MNIFSIILLLSVTFVDANTTNAGALRGSESRSRLESRLESEIPCEEARITVEFMTDKYPKDNSWSLTDMRGWEDNEIVFKSTPEGYTERYTLYKKEFCLPESTYELIVHDTYGDGVCCVQGNGYYRVLDKCGRVILDSEKNSEPFIYQSNFFEVHSNDSDDICSPMGYCEDHIEKSFRWKKNYGRSLTCQEWAQKNYCRTEVLNNDNNNKGKFIWEVCPKSCDKCDNMPPTAQPSEQITVSTGTPSTTSSIFSSSSTTISTEVPSSTGTSTSSISIDSNDDVIETEPPSSILSTSSTFSTSVDDGINDDVIETEPPSSILSTSSTFSTSADDDINDDVIETEPPSSILSTSTTFSTSADNDNNDDVVTEPPSTTGTFLGSSSTTATEMLNESAAPSESPSATGSSSTTAIETSNESAAPSESPSATGSSSTTAIETSNESAAPSESPSATGSSSTTATEISNEIINSCQDEMNKDETFRWKKKDGRSLTCQKWAQQNYCDTEILNNDKNNKGKFIREVCQKTCDKCDTISTTIDPTESPIFSDSEGGTPISTATPTATNEAACVNSSDPFVDNKGELTTCAAIDALDDNKKEKKCNKAVVIRNCRGICDEECHE